MKGKPFAQACGVLMNRLKSVITGEAALYCRFFGRKLYQEHFADTPESARALMDLFRENANFPDSGTAIQNCLEATRDRIEALLKQNETLTRPQLVCVTDGDDSVNLKVDEFSPTVCHAFLVGGDNDDLKKFVVETGGIHLKL